jgi:hypothetical protein
MRRLPLILFLAVVCFLAAIAQDKPYSGPRPPKPDIPYLVHADNLVQTEVADAKEDSRKDESLYTIPGAASTARTPVAEPIFLFQSDKITPDSLELYPLEVKGGNRQVLISQSKRGARPLRLTVTPLGNKLYRIEVDQGLGLPDGQYALSPGGSNRVFCFEEY